MRNPHVYVYQLQRRYFITYVVENRRPQMVSDMDTMLSCIFNFCLAKIALLWAQGLPQGSFINTTLSILFICSF